MPFYSRGAGAPRVVCTASMVELGRGHWPKWRRDDVEEAGVMLQELVGVMAGVGEVAGAGRGAGELEIHGGLGMSARCSMKCRHHVLGSGAMMEGTVEHCSGVALLG